VTAPRLKIKSESSDNPCVFLPQALA